MSETDFKIVIRDKQGVVLWSKYDLLDLEFGPFTIELSVGDELKHREVIK